MNERPAKHPTPAQSFLLFRQQAGWAGRGEDGIETLLASYQVKPEHKREQKPLLTEGLTGAEIEAKFMENALMAVSRPRAEAMRDAVLEHKADVGLGFDGDGDRCGIVDNEGDEIFADKVGVMLARGMTREHPGATFVVDVKSTGLFVTDPVLKAQGAKVEYWKTGHSYMKRRTNEVGAIAGFEKSGHFFFNAPVGRGYDDGLVSAIAICEMLDRAPDKSMADLKEALPKTWSSPTFETVASWPMLASCSSTSMYG